MSRPRKTKISLGGAPSMRLEPTPERIARAGTGALSIDSAGTRRLADAFELLSGRQLLDREDRAWNALLCEAGERYRRHWHRARLDGLKAFDFTRESVDGRNFAETISPTEAAQRQRDVIRDADAAVGPRLLPYLQGIVIESRTVAEVRTMVADSAHARTAEALALERLREALHRLCEHWRMHPGSERRAIRSERLGVRPPPDPSTGSG